MGPAGQKAECGPGVPHVGDVKEIPDYFDRLKLMEGPMDIGLGDLIEKEDHAKDHD
jgi:hypothetical protein